MTEREWLEGDDPLKMVSMLTAHAHPPVEPGGWRISFYRHQHILQRKWETGYREFFTSQRKIRLYLVTICKHRDIWKWLTPTHRRGVELVEDNTLSPERSEIRYMIDQLREQLGELRPYYDGGWPIMRDNKVWQATWLARQLLIPDMEAHTALAVSHEGQFVLIPQREKARILHELFGNPHEPIKYGTARERDSGYVEYDRRPLDKWENGLIKTKAEEIYKHKLWWDMPLLGDMLVDAGCEDDTIIQHCQDPVPNHTRGCWVLDHILGYK